MTVPLPTRVATAQAGALHRRQLRQAGLDHRSIAARLRRGDLTEVAKDVFVVAGTPDTWHCRIWCRLLQARPGSLACHRTAGRLFGVGRFEEFEDILEVEETHHRIQGGSAHKSSLVPPEHRSFVGTIPVTSLARTLFDLAGIASTRRWVRGWPSIPVAQAERALDDALLAGLPISDVQAVFDSLAGRGRPGTVLMRRLLAERGEGHVATESELEDLVLRVLRDHDLPLPARQKVLGGPDAPVGRVDFVYLAERVVIEADGRKFHSAIVDSDADRWRDLELMAAGWVVVRVRYRQLTTEPGRFASRIERLLAARAA